MALADIHKIIDVAVGRYSDGMQKTANNIIRRITPVLKSLPTDIDKKVVRSSAVDGVASSISEGFAKGLNTGEVYGRLARFIRDTLEPIDKAIRLELRTVETDATRALKIVYRNQLDSSLIPSRLQDALLPPAINDFYGLVSDNVTAEKMLKTMQQKLGQRVETFSKNIAATLAQQYTRNLNEIYSSQRGLQFVQYTGPKDAGNREFCAHRANLYFHILDVKSWAVEDWEGKIPGTNAMNIPVLLGGFNCRHVLRYVPITEVPQNVVKKAQRNRWI